VVEKLYELTQGKAIITTEVGQNQMWAAQYYHFDRPGHFITSGGLGCHGLRPAGRHRRPGRLPDKLVVDVAGDGSIQMNIQEMATAMQYGLPVKVVILNNGYLGMVRQWQELFYDKRYACTCHGPRPDFVKLAEAYGAVGLRATRPEEVEARCCRRGWNPPAGDHGFRGRKGRKRLPHGAGRRPITEMLLV
jgi:acetolactate synthase-1/2/3 large subunit